MVTVMMVMVAMMTMTITMLVMMMLISETPQHSRSLPSPIFILGNNPSMILFGVKECQNHACIFFFQVQHFLLDSAKGLGINVQLDLY